MEVLWKGPFLNVLGWHLAKIVAVNFVGGDDEEEGQSFSAATSIVRVPRQEQRCVCNISNWTTRGSDALA